MLFASRICDSSDEGDDRTLQISVVWSGAGNRKTIGRDEIFERQIRESGYTR